ncbi:intermediate transcription factor VITF-3 [Turkeypox virus]|uniref:Intermediate transcription factor 3 large subunit n=1 Tax=Turkeypox virus TaxID=336486 RepID=A0A0M3ZHZ9_9POXV|nr:intermediate transcription factor VITF-3 [Turkeypox virus]ALA62512.1 intermediate transcription factor VITF-3 [Turkeypox virus]
MYDLFIYLHKIENRYIRTIFNFHIRKCDEITNIYNIIKAKIASETNFNNVIDIRFNNHIKKLIYCDINITKHIINQSSYAIKTRSSKKTDKIIQYFEINMISDTPTSRKTRDIFLNDKSSLVSYIKTTNKKCKIDYGEIKRTINSHYKSMYYSGRRSDEYMCTTVYKDKNKPWIKSISKKLTLDIDEQSIITRGKSSILQTIEIIYTNRTCIKIFKDSTIHVILSKDKSETTCKDTINKLFTTYTILFDFIGYITGNENFNKYKDIVSNIVNAESFEEKIRMIKEYSYIYGIYNFKIGMFNITYKLPINVIVFTSLMDANSKIKFFKGKKLNIVALSSLKDCIRYVEEADNILDMMKKKSEELDKVDIVTASVDKLKSIVVWI